MTNLEKGKCLANSKFGIPNLENSVLSKFKIEHAKS